MNLDKKFIPPFIKFINEEFNSEEHLFLIIGKRKKEDYVINSSIKNIYWLDNKLKVFKLQKYLYKSKKIILHGLWNKNLIQLLYVQPWLLKKSYWVMWGGDFYFPEKHSSIKKLVIKNIKNVITYVDGDVEYIKTYYKANPIYHKCIAYLSNVFDENKYENCEKINKSEIWILIGNSAVETNRHELVFSRLEEFKNKEIKIIVPLSYGYEEYKNKIIEIGKKEFGNKFIPIIEFLNYEKYLNLLYNVDIAIFVHNRQQGMGNLIQLLGLGKKVYFNTASTQWKFFQDLGIKAYDFNDKIDLNVNTENLENNKKIISNYFSIEKLREQWRKIIYGDYINVF